MNLFSNRKCFYSCLVDDSPKFYYQGFVFLIVLVYMAGVNPKRIFVHVTGRNENFEKFVFNIGVNLVRVSKWGDNKWCNKLQQTETPQLWKASYVFLCDTDLLILEDLDHLAGSNQIVGKTVDLNNPSLDILEKIYNFFDTPYPRLSFDTLNEKPTFSGNFNGGLYGIPGKKLKDFGVQWKQYASSIFESPELIDSLGEKAIHVDQISFSLALNNSGLDYNDVGVKFNWPYHIESMVSAKITDQPKVVHYHDEIDSNGFIKEHPQSVAVSSVREVNILLRQHFNNGLFWDFRYFSHAQLGSGIGSRGHIANYKTRLLCVLGAEFSGSVLDFGFGDRAVTNPLKFKSYQGFDISQELVQIARNQTAKDLDFHLYPNEAVKAKPADLSICLDVLIHQASREAFLDTLHFLSDHTVSRTVVSGYDFEPEQSPICFFWQPIKEALLEQGKYDYVFRVGSYRGLSVYVGDRSELARNRSASNDICNSVLDKFLGSPYIDADSLLFCVLVSRLYFGWFTKHLPRLYEYPWLISMMPHSLDGMRVAEFGAGLSPLPLILAQRGAAVHTIDNSSIIRDVFDLDNANEWGFIDYSEIFDGIISYNEDLVDHTFAPNSLDCWYSISVVEHMPAEIRRMIFKIMANTLKVDGKLYLTLDLKKGSNDLWDLSGGELVDSDVDHGDKESIIFELERVGFKVDDIFNVEMPSSERVDVLFLSAVKRLVGV